MYYNHLPAEYQYVFKPLHSPSMQLQLKLAVYATNEHVTKTKIVFEV